MALRSLEGRYTPMLLVALCSLVPYILVASAATLYRPQVVGDIGASTGTLSIVEGISTAAYAFGALLAGDLINRVSQHRLFFACQGLFIAGWLLVAVSWGPLPYGVGRIAAGFATGMLLVTALPPVVRRFPPARLPVTAAFINLGLFGAVAAGPLLGGIVAEWHAWRWLYAAFALLGLAIVATAGISLPRTPPSDPELKFDLTGLAFGFAATFLPFWASGELSSHGFSSGIVAIPLLIGLASFVGLMLIEYHRRHALAPIKKMWTTFPVIGTIIAMVGGGAFVTLVLLTVQFLLKVEGLSPLSAGLTFLPQVVGVIITAVLLGVLFRTRYLPVLAFGGMVIIIGGGVLLALLGPSGSRVQLLSAVGLLGLGAGATVSPGLFLAGMSLPSRILGRIFALIELVRSVADFIMAPVMVKIAEKSSETAPVSAAGIHEAIVVTLIITGASIILCLVLYGLGGVGLPRPDLEAWLEKDGTALASPDLASVVRAR